MASGSSRLWLVLIAVAPLSDASAVAQENGASCAPIESDAERLACYDSIFRSPAGPSEAAADTLSVTLESLRTMPARPSGRAPATFAVICDAGALRLEFRFANQLVSATGSGGAITLQPDLQSPRTRSLAASDDNLALVMDRRDDVVAFLDSIIGARNLLVRTTPVNQRSASVTFDLAGFEEAVRPVRDACN